MRRAIGPIGVALIALVAWQAAGAPKEEPAKTPRAESVTTPPPTAKYMGAGSCSAVACHGTVEGAQHVWQGAYSLWVTSDKVHSGAYSRLFDKCAVKMTELLGMEKPHKEARCLACHAIDDPHAPEKPHAAKGTNATNVPHAVTRKALRADGVSCEACHGPAEHWLAVHATPEWQQWPAEKKYGYGTLQMRPLRGQMLGRAQQCAGCHVGEPAEGDRPLRLVDHDLIAAGHPPLRFEFANYLDRMPRHWDPSADEKRIPDYWARAWAVGQAATAAAELKLVASQSASGAADKQAAPWPDFSHFSCFACHQNFDGESIKREGARSSPLGGVPLARWYLWSHEALAKSAGREPLAELMNLAASDEKLSDVAARGASELDVLAAILDRPGGSEHIRRALKALFKRHAKEGELQLDWDEAVQAYRAMSVLERSERRGATVGSAAGGITKLLDDTRKLLLLGKPAKDADGCALRRFNSPPRENVEKARDELIKAWQELGEPKSGPAIGTGASR